MNLARFAKEYLAWHYRDSLSDLWELENNFLWFGYHFFSLPLLARTFLSPIYRLEEKSARTFDIGAIIGNFIVTTLMRLVGMLVRVVIIATGVLFESALIALALPVLLLWLLLPILAILFGIFGVAILFV